MKKLFPILLAVLLSSLLTSCSGCGNDTSDIVADIPKEETTQSPTEEIEEPEETVMELVDLSDNDIYYAVVDGVTYDLDTVIQDILDSGFVAFPSPSDMDKVIEPDKAADYFYANKGEGIGKTYFSVTPMNRSDSPITVAESTIKGMGLQDIWTKDVSVIGGLTLGSSLEEVAKVFGNDYYEKAETYVLYKSEGENNGEFWFIFDKSNNVVEIRFQSNGK